MNRTNVVVPERSLSAVDCKGLADVLASVGDTWTMLVVGTLSNGSLRYNEIQRRIGGISQRMLTLTLKRLETDGIVTRTAFPSVPPRVDYELTELGHKLRAALVPLHLWAAASAEVIAAHRRRSGPRASTEAEARDRLAERAAMKSDFAGFSRGGAGSDHQR